MNLPDGTAERPAQHLDQFPRSSYSTGSGLWNADAPLAGRTAPDLNNPDERQHHRPRLPVGGIHE
ncbi:MAG: hypothetical protein QOF83_2646 [Solirubrobacteraceae bacterium]|jgi:hypothetical protein|nr:hypothetical protein [Solirubrobacteraceae bacterium]